MSDIDFTKIRKTSGGDRSAFEELCCMIIARLDSLPPSSQHHIPSGSRYDRFEGAGGDGGVECIWTLPSGEKRAYQAKYFEKFASSEKQQMAKSFKSALLNHPEIGHYTFIFPVNPTGPTGKSKKITGKPSQHQQA
jgi:hypothetical protein